MSCPTPQQLAAAVAGEDDASVAHAGACVACHHVLAAQRDLRLLLASAPAPSLTRDRRAELAAEVLARAERLPMQRSRASRAVIVAIAAAASVLAIAIAARDGEAPAELPVIVLPAEVPSTSPQRMVEVASIEAVPEPAPPGEPAVARLTGRADYARSTVSGTDTVVLRDGELTIDSRLTRPVEITSGRTGVRIAGAKVEVAAHGGVVSTVTVFAGTVEVIRGGRSYVIEAGAVWHPEPPHVDALAAFRTGWEALRARRHREAIEHFDLATDPVVAEDAAYWAAVATERAGNRDDARRRLADFLVRFPGSPRAGTARAALERLAR